MRKGTNLDYVGLPSIKARGEGDLNVARCERETSWALSATHRLVAEDIPAIVSG